jgi:Hint domain
MTNTNKYLPGTYTQTVTLTNTSYNYYITGTVDPLSASPSSPAVLSNTAGITLTNQEYIFGGNGGGTGAGGIGVDFTQAGTVTNSKDIYGGSGYGSFTGGIGVSMSGGSLTNDHGANIKGGESFGTGAAGAGVSLAGGTLSNAGDITGGPGFSSGRGAGAGGDGVDLTSAGTLTDNTGQISGGEGLTLGGIGVNASGKDTILTSHGSITGGSVYAGAGSTGIGGVGVTLASGATLTNYGTIQGGNGSAEGPRGVGANIASGGTLKNMGTGSINDGATVASGGTLTNSGKIAAGGHYADSPGTGFGVDVNGGALTTTGGTIDGVYLNGGTLNSGTLTTSAYITSGFGGADVAFGSGGSTMTINSGATFHPAFSIPNITGFAVGDTIDVTYQAPGTVKAEFDTSTYTLTLSKSDPTLTTLIFGGSFAGDTFSFNPDDHGTGSGTYITLEAACYLRGTRILTRHGEMAIESLKIGDHVITTAGIAQPIRWIGRRGYRSWFASGNRDIAPIRIRAGAIADDMPRRDLWVSPEHAMFIDGMLIPAAALVNGESIIQEETVEDVTYFHLEFASHAVILAEGAPAESFVDDASRDMFDNVAEFHELYPNANSEPARFCAPRVEDGEELEIVRRRLAERCGVSLGMVSRRDRVAPPVRIGQ